MQDQSYSISGVTVGWDCVMQPLNSAEFIRSMWATTCEGDKLLMSLWCRLVTVFTIKLILPSGLSFPNALAWNVSRTYHRDRVVKTEFITILSIDRRSRVIKEGNSRKSKRNYFHQAPALETTKKSPTSTLDFRLNFPSTNKGFGMYFKIHLNRITLPFWKGRMIYWLTFPLKDSPLKTPPRITKEKILFLGVVLISLQIFHIIVKMLHVWVLQIYPYFISHYK